MRKGGLLAAGASTSLLGNGRLVFFRPLEWRGTRRHLLVAPITDTPTDYISASHPVVKAPSIYIALFPGRCPSMACMTGFSMFTCYFYTPRKMLRFQQRSFVHQCEIDAVLLTLFPDVSASLSKPSQSRRYTRTDGTVWVTWTNLKSMYLVIRKIFPSPVEMNNTTMCRT
ncbi:hypothetical protein F5Y15DRAFT_118725 [Xylariaceae sp. FL0016]|nr:hypothetical protein F5Y15DRAFT_118725 [Xylariaceae sp. FL0016]